MPTARPLTRPTAASRISWSAEPKSSRGEAERDRDADGEQRHDRGVARAGAERGDDGADQQQLDEDGLLADREVDRGDRADGDEREQEHSATVAYSSRLGMRAQPRIADYFRALGSPVYTARRMHDFDRDPEGVVRVRAPNPSALTLDGTNTYVVGRWVVDPGPADDEPPRRRAGGRAPTASRASCSPTGTPTTPRAPTSWACPCTGRARGRRPARSARWRRPGTRPTASA